MLVKTEAIVLHSFRYGETRVIVDLFTRERGRLSVIVTLSKTAQGRMKKQYFQPMNQLETTCDIRPRVQLQKLRDVRLLHPYTSIPFDPAKLGIALFNAEFLYHALRSEQQDQPLYDYISGSMQWLDAARQGYANHHLVFLMHLSRFLGFYPNLDGYEEGAAFDLRSGSFSSLIPLHRDFLRLEEAARIHLLMRMDYANMHLFRLSRQERNQILDVLMRYYRLHLPDFPELKSLGVLQELFV